VLAVGADTTVEQHAPHLPLATDTLQTHAVLAALASEFPDVRIGPALEYGHLTWGLPFGASIDLTPPLLLRYAAGCFAALVARYHPSALYVADVHGSIVHRDTLRTALATVTDRPTAFRWLYDPLVADSVAVGDVHAGGVETALVHRISPDLVDAAWWPARTAELAAGALSHGETVTLAGDLPRFIARVERASFNGIVGDIVRAATLDGTALFARQLAVARADVAAWLR
jgi:creatinine amidohydrolase